MTKHTLISAHLAPKSDSSPLYTIKGKSTLGDTKKITKKKYYCIITIVTPIIIYLFIIIINKKVKLEVQNKFSYIYFIIFGNLYIKLQLLQVLAKHLTF